MYYIDNQPIPPSFNEDLSFTIKSEEIRICKVWDNDKLGKAHVTVIHARLTCNKGSNNLTKTDICINELFPMMNWYSG